MMSKEEFPSIVENANNPNLNKKKSSAWDGISIETLKANVSIKNNRPTATYYNKKNDKDQVQEKKDRPTAIYYNKKNDMDQVQEKKEEEKPKNRPKKLNLQKKYKPIKKDIETDDDIDSNQVKEDKPKIIEEKSSSNSNDDTNNSTNKRKINKKNILDEKKDIKNINKRKISNNCKSSQKKSDEEDIDDDSNDSQPTKKNNQLKKVQKEDKLKKNLNNRSKPINDRNKVSKFIKNSYEEEDSDDSEQIDNGKSKPKNSKQESNNDKLNRNKRKKIDEEYDDEIDHKHKQKRNEIKRKKVQNYDDEEEEENDNKNDKYKHKQKKSDIKNKKAKKYGNEEEDVNDEDDNSHKYAPKRKEIKRPKVENSDEEDESSSKRKPNINEDRKKPSKNSKSSNKKGGDGNENNAKHKAHKNATKNSDDSEVEISSKKARNSNESRRKAPQQSKLTTNSKSNFNKRSVDDDDDDDDQTASKRAIKSKQKQPKKDTKPANVDKKLSASKKKMPETVMFTTFIELDMHGDDPRIKKVLDWVPIIRDALFDALERKVDFVNFITGQGKHSRKKQSVLRPLVLLTSKRLGFDSKLDDENPGVVVCDITSYKEDDPDEEEEEEDNDDDEEIDKSNSDLFKTFGVGISKININDYSDILQKRKKKRKNAKKKKNSDSDSDPDSDSDSDFDLDESDSDDDEEYNNHKKGLGYKKAAFKAVKKRYPLMPKVCIEIICTNRSKNEAVKFTQLFEMAIKKNDFEGNAKNSRKRVNIESSIVMAKMKEQKIFEMKMAQNFRKEYRFDREIIDRVVQETKKKKKARAILDKIMDVPSDFYIYLAQLFTEYQIIPVKSILDACDEEDYVIENVQQRLISNSMAAVQNALGVLKVDNQISTKRKDGSPKFIPSIEIDLSKVGVTKAQITIDRIMNALSNGNYSEMILKFSNNPKTCKINDVVEFVKHKARDESVHIRQRNEKAKNRYHFAIINDDHDIEDELEEEEEEVKDNDNGVVIEEEEEVNSSENDD